MEEYIVKELLHFCNIMPKRCSRIDSHVIGYYDLTFVLRGSMEYFVNGESVTLLENDAILLPPGTARGRSAGESRVHYVSYNFLPYDGSVLPQEIYLKNAVTREMRSLCDIFSEQHISPFYHSREKQVSVLNCILYELIDRFTLGSNDKNVMAALKYIDENLTRRITVDDIAAAVHISRDHLAHSFKREISRSVIDYVNERRMLLARSMIRSGEMSLSDISDTLGYDSYSYFSRVFKRYFGVSPIKYR